VIVATPPQSKRGGDADGQEVHEAQTHKNSRSHRQPADDRTSHLTSADGVLGKDRVQDVADWAEQLRSAAAAVMTLHADLESGVRCRAHAGAEVPTD